MARVLIAFASDRGATRRMAHAVAEGAASVPGATVDLRELADERLTEISLDDARACDALIVGTSMRHRSMHHRVKLFVENVLEVIWMTDDMVGKVGGVFTVGGGHGNNGAGCELAQVGLLAAMAANGLVLVTHPKCTPGFDEAGSHWGPNGRTGDVKMRPHPLTDGMLAAGHHHGANVARVAAALVAGAGGRDLFARGNVAPAPEVLAMFQSATAGSMAGSPQPATAVASPGPGVAPA